MTSLRTSCLLGLFLTCLAGFTWPAIATTGAQSTSVPQAPTLQSLKRPLFELSLREALEVLRAEGLDLLFSDRLVRRHYRVQLEPSGSTPEQRLLELLRPHNLTARKDQGGRWVIVRSAKAQVYSLRGKVVERRTGRAVSHANVAVTNLGISTTTDRHGLFVLTSKQPGLFQVRVVAKPFPDRLLSARFRPDNEHQALNIELDLPVVPLEEIIVTPSAYEITHSEPVTAIGVSRNERDTLPIPGDDVFRTVSTFSGTASGDFSAQFFPRGGREDEVLVLLDGLELYEPYHLKDLDNALSVVAPQSIDSLELRIGGFSAAYGDKISGLLDMTTVRPKSQPAGHLGLSPIDVSATLGDANQAGTRSWFVSGRQGLIRETLKLFNDDERPAFSDLFGKLEWQPTGRHTLRLEGLDAKDDIKITKPLEQTSSIFKTDHVWASHTGILGQKTVVTSTAFFGRIDEDRVGESTDPQRQYLASDRRDVDILGFDQRWSTQLTPSQSLKWGGSLREITTLYDYQLSLNIEDPLAALRTQPTTLETRFEGELDGRQGSAFGSYRTSLADRLTVETGLRFEESHVIDDEHVSPRILAAYSLSERTVLRASWGFYYQSLRSHELLVEDGETAFPADEVAKKSVLGLEHAFTNGLRMRIEAYERRVENPRLRFVNLFDPVTPFPETEIDRVRLEATQSRARGIELALQKQGRTSSWRASYALSRSRDQLAQSPGLETVSTPRFFDQTHALRLVWSRTFRSHWHLNLDAQVHTGWPTSELALHATGNGQSQLLVPTAKINQDRLPTFQRVDAALRRNLQSRWGNWTFSFEILNLLGSANLRGFEITTSTEGSETLVEKRDLLWLGWTPSISVRLRF